MANEFNEQVNIVVSFTEKGLAKFKNDAIRTLNEVASSGLQGNVGASQITELQSQLRGVGASLVRQAREQIASLPKAQQTDARAAVTDVSKQLRTAVDQLVAAIRRAAGPEGVNARVQEQLQQRSVAAQEAVIRNAALLGTTPPQVFKNKDILGGTSKFITNEEATQQREAFAQYQEALLQAAQTLRRIAAIDSQDGGRVAYVEALAEAAAEEKTLSAEIRADLKKRLASTDVYVQAQAESSLAERDLASRIKQSINRRVAEANASSTGLLPTEAGPASRAQTEAAATQERVTTEAVSTLQDEINAILATTAVEKEYATTKEGLIRLYRGEILDAKTGQLDPSLRVKGDRAGSGSFYTTDPATALAHSDVTKLHGLEGAYTSRLKSVDVTLEELRSFRKDLGVENAFVVSPEVAVRARELSDAEAKAAVELRAGAESQVAAITESADATKATSTEQRAANDKVAAAQAQLAEAVRHAAAASPRNGGADPNGKMLAQVDTAYHTLAAAIRERARLESEPDTARAESLRAQDQIATEVTAAQSALAAKIREAAATTVGSPERVAADAAVVEAQRGYATKVTEFTASLTTGPDTESVRRANADVLAASEQLATRIKEATAAVGTENEGAAQAKVVAAQNELAARYKAQASAAGPTGSGGPSVENAQGKLVEGLLQAAAAVAGEAEQTDVAAVIQREASNKVSDAMNVAAAKLAEIAAISSEVAGGVPAYVAAQADAAFSEKFLAQAIATEASEREAASAEYLALVKRANAAQANVNAAITEQAASLRSGTVVGGGGGPGAGGLPANWFQKLQASVSNRGGGTPRDASTFQQLPQFLAQKALTTGGFAVSGAAFYGTYTAIRTAVDEANKFQVALVALEQEFKAADSAGEFPAAKRAILDLSNETGVAASQIAGVAQTFKGAFGDTKTTIQETTDALKLSVVAGLPTADITNFVLAIDTAFHTTAKNIGDLALSVFEQTGVGVHEILTGLGTIAPVAQDAGLSLKEITVILGVAEQKSGRSAQSIAENFSRVLPAIQKNGTAILDLIQTVPGLDKEFLQLGQDLNSGQTGKFFLDLTNSFAKLNPVAQKTAIELLGGRREAGALIPVLENAAQVNDILSKSTDNNGKSAQYFAKQLDTLHQQVAILGSEFRNFVGDLLRSGIASGLGDALKFVGFLLGGLQQVETVFKSINKLSHGLSGDVAIGFAAFKGFNLARAALGGAQRGINLGETTGLNAAAVGLQGSAVALSEAAVALNGAAAGGAASNLGSSALGNLGRRGAAGAAAGEVTDLYAGAATKIPILPSIPVLPIALGTLAGFALYKQAADQSKKLNAQASEAAKKIVEQYVSQHKDALNAFNEQQTANLGLSSSAEADVVRRAREQTGKDFEKQQGGFKPFTPGPSKGILPFKIPFVSDFFQGGFNKSKSDTQDTAAKAARDDILRTYNEKTTKPFLEALKQAAADGGALDIATPRIKDLKDAVKKAQNALDQGILSGLSVRKVLDLKSKLDDAKSILKDTQDQKGLGLATIGKAASDDVASLIKYIGDGTNKKRNKELQDFIKAESNSNNPAVRETVLRAKTILANAKAQASAVANQAQTETGLDTLKQLYAAGAVSASTYLHALRGRINGLQELATKSPLTPELKLELAKDLKEENDIISQLADAAQADAEFLAGLTQSGPQLAQTKVALARAKLASLQTHPGDARTTAAKDLLTAQQDAFSQSLSLQSPDDAYKHALEGFKPDTSAVDIIIKDQKDRIAGERTVLGKQRDSIQKAISNLENTKTKTRGHDTGIQRQIRDYRAKLAEVADATAALSDIPIVDPAVALSKQVADAQNQRALAADLIRAGDDQVKQSAARLKSAAKLIQDDKRFYGTVLPEDAAAYFVAYNDLLFQKAFAAEQERERAIQLKISATRNPEAKAALEKALANTKAAYAASIAKIPGHSDAAKTAANDAAQATITANNDATSNAEATAKARLDLLAAMTGDPVKLAQIALQQADVEAQFAQGAAAQLAAAAHKVQAQRQLTQALLDARKAYSGFLIAVANFYGDGVKAAQLALDEANRELQDAVRQGLGSAEISNRAAAAVTAQRALLDASLQAKEATIDFNLQMKKISTSQAIALYTALLSTKNTVQEQRDLLLKIQSLKASLNQDLQFNLPTDLNLPTLYEARRFKQGGGAQGFAETNATNASQFNDNRKIEITVNGAQDTKAVVAGVVAAINAPPRNGVRPRIY